MAGTADNPIIVSTWNEYVAALTAFNAYIEWTENVHLEEVTISSQIQCNCTKTNFNGLVIDNLYVVNIQEEHCFSRLVEASNIEIKHAVIGKTAYPNISLFDKVSTSYISLAYEDRDSEYTGFDTYPIGAIPVANDSIIEMTSKDYNPRVPTALAYNCEIIMNYKWTKTGANGYILFDRTGEGALEYYNCYFGGKLDVSEGTGLWNFSYDRSPYTWWGFTLSACIYNVETIISENCTIGNFRVLCPSDSGASSWADIPEKSLIVINNGNAMARYQDIISEWGYVKIDGEFATAVRTLEGDLRNKDWLSDRAFNFVEDDNFRAPKFWDITYPLDLWAFRKSNYVNRSVPFLPFYKYPVVEPPVYRGDVYEAEYICIYDLATQQDGFTGHGLAILRPTSCRVVEELNGAYNLTLTHPKDPEGRWQYILEMNIIKCMGQLFVIQRVDETLTGGSYSVTAYAEHISYTLNDRWIFPPVTIAGYHGSTLMASILEQSTDMGGDWQTQYTFTVESDIDAPEEFRDWYEMPDGVTPYEMLLGSQGFIAKLGGELYRDNFTLKINERMYGAQDNAFELAIGYNLTGIKRTVDLTTFCTYFRAYDTSDGYYETWFAISYDPSSLPRAYPRNVVRSANFTYDHDEYKEGTLERDAFAFWGQHCAPLITYELSVKDLRNSPDYKYFVNNYRFRVGDKGRVWDERLQAWVEVEITRTEKDGITGDTTKVIIGSQRSFTRPNSYNPIVPVVIDADKTLEGYLPLTFNSDGNKLKHCIIYGSNEGVGDEQILNFTTVGTTHYSTETGQADSETGYYSIDMISLYPTTYTVTAQFAETSEPLEFEILYYDTSYAFSHAETATTAASSFTFTITDETPYVRIQAATQEVITGFDLVYYQITLTMAGYTTKYIYKTLSAKLYDGDSVDFTNEIETFNGENTLDITSEDKPRVSIQYREPIDKDINKTMEDPLPLTFRSNGQNLQNWIIWGNTGGVGSLSPNLFNKGLNNDRYRYNNGQKNGTSTDYITSADYMECESNTTYSLVIHVTTTMDFGNQTVYIFQYDSNKNFVQRDNMTVSAVSANESRNGFGTVTTQATTAYVIISWNVNGKTNYLNLDTVKDFMWYLGNTKKDYTPYGGGQISITVTSGNNSSTVNIPITEMLEAGQTISLTTSGVNIPTYNGTNTITVDSTVQPEKMKIQYQEPIS